MVRRVNHLIFMLIFRLSSSQSSVVQNKESERRIKEKNKKKVYSESDGRQFNLKAFY